MKTNQPTAKTVEPAKKKQLDTPLLAILCGFTYLGAGLGAMLLEPNEAALMSLIGATVIVATLVWMFFIKRAKSRITLDDKAVSPVIGVILMVAITVVLAAVVFLLVNRLAQSPQDQAPDMAFSADGDGEVTVITAELGLDWSDFTVTGCTTTPTGTVDAGDQMTGCTGRVTVVHDETNTLVWEHQLP